MIYSIYKITNLINNKVYIGYTGKTVEKRYSQHITNALNGAATLLHKSIRKYGVDSFCVECIYQSTDLNFVRDVMESYFIEQYSSFFSAGHGYNMTRGGDGGDTSNSATYKAGIARRNISGPNNPMWGGFSSQHKKNLSESKKGIKPPNFGVWSKSAKGKSFWHDPVSGIESRFNPSDVPNGWVKGRLKTMCSCGTPVDCGNMQRHLSSKFHETLLRQSNSFPREN